MPRAKWKFVSRFKLRLQLLKEQQSIAHILGSSDDKIEQNRYKNETFEAKVKTIFKDWFVLTSTV